MLYLFCRARPTWPAISTLWARSCVGPWCHEKRNVSRPWQLMLTWIHHFEARLWDLTNHPNFKQPLELLRLPPSSCWLKDLCLRLPHRTVCWKTLSDTFLLLRSHEGGHLHSHRPRRSNVLVFHVWFAWVGDPSRLIELANNHEVKKTIPT